MSDITQCPTCRTRFKVSAEQLDAHDGLVRCGRCQEVFNAHKYLQDDEPSPQLLLPIENEVQLDETAGDFVEHLVDIQPPAIDESPSEVDLTPRPDIQGLEEDPLAPLQQDEIIEEHGEEVTTPPQHKRAWIGMLAALLLVLTLIGQASYFFRVELAAHLPGTKPLLSRYCSLLGCNIELPRQDELMSIESSELESDRAQSNLITLHALLHNRATYTQAYPSLELTLTDMQDQAVARRIFHPADYLNPSDEAQKGLAANRELALALRMDTTDLKPAGYRLFLFYPQ